jgi:hypothetical protein
VKPLAVRSALAGLALLCAAGLAHAGSADVRVPFGGAYSVRVTSL